MASKIKALTADPRWEPFVLRYAFDAARFAVEVCGMNGPKNNITWQQQELFDSVSGFGSRTSVSSGHGTGKTRSFAVIALWHMLCYADSNTYLTAPKLATLQEGIWKEFSSLKEVIEQGPHAWIAEYFDIKAKKVFVKGAGLRWFITCRTAPRGSPEGMAGTHGAYLMWLADEASGIPDANMMVIGGALTDKRNRFAMASQPTRSSGFFYDTHHKLSTSNGGPWTSLTFNSEDSPIVSEEFIAQKVLEYGGYQSPEYQIKVMGRFPEHSDKYLLSRASIERRMNAGSVIKDDEAYGNVLLVDVAAGIFRDKTVVTQARIIGYGGPESDDPRRVDFLGIPVFSNSFDWTDAAARVAHLARELSNCTVAVDVGGQGVQFAKLLERLEVPNIIKINWGITNFRKEYKERFLNQRAQSNVHLKYAVEQGRVSIPEDHSKDMLDQGSRIPFFFDEKARWQIQSKEKMKEDGIPSPDIWDTFAFAYLECVTYIQSDDGGGSGVDARKASARTRALEALGLGATAESTGEATTARLHPRRAPVSAWRASRGRRTRSRLTTCRPIGRSPPIYASIYGSK